MLDFGIPRKVTDGNTQLFRTARAGLSARYLTALRRHLGDRRAGKGNRAQSMGRAALAGGMATLDLAIMHEEAVVALAPSHDFTDARNGPLKRAGVFFTNALMPIEAAQRATRETNGHLRQRNEMLRVHTADLATGNRRLEREIKRRKAGEEAVIKVKEQYRQLLLQSHVMQKKLRRMTHQIILAQEEERKEISRELHDEVVQTLVGINVQLSALGKGASVGLHALKEKIALTQRLVENSVNAVHRFARELRPAVLDDLGLIPALHTYCKGLAARKNIKIDLKAFSGVEGLGSAKRTVLYRVAQEALTNVVRHAQATQASVEIREVPGRVRMEISDDGRSFPVEQTLQARNPNRLGLLGMRERVEMVFGTLAIKSVPGKGTTVCAEIPSNREKIKK